MVPFLCLYPGPIHETWFLPLDLDHRGAGCRNRGRSGAAAGARKDAQSSFEPRSRPGAGQKYLESFVGAWEVVKVFHPRAGELVRTSGTCRQTMIHDGRFLQSEFVFDQGGRKSTGLGLIGFDTPTGRFTSVWTDSRQTRMSLRQSRAVRRQGDRPIQPDPR